VTGLVARLGLAIVQPREALAIAGERRNAGRSGGDLLVAFAVLLLATELRGLAGAVWLGAAVDVGFGARMAVDVLARAISVDLALLVIGALALWLAAGPRRELGRAFDLACVVVLPLVAVALVATVFVRAFDLEVPRRVAGAIASCGYAWSAFVFALAVRVVRGQGARASEPVRRARWAGLALVAIAATGIAVQVAWLVRHGDLVRPIVHGDRAPQLALPAIGPGGARGPIVTLPTGKPAVVDFWATWCGPCLRAMPQLDAFARAHPEVEVIAVNVDDPAEARAIFDAHSYALALVADDGSAAERYGVRSYPHTVVIDGAGMVRVVARGDVDLESALRETR
jgi:thiol-disulfide isomerase/thioredoxin